MGDPKKSKKAYARPNRPWDKDRIDSEKIIKQTYGLRRKKEIWKVETILSDYRKRSRELIANFDEEKSKILLNKLYSMGLLVKNATIDDVLELKAEQLLDRRLQTIVFKSELANTVKQARQFIVHGHIKINNQKMTAPSYIVKIDEEKNISYTPNSSLTKTFVVSKKNKVEIEKPIIKKLETKKIKIDDLENEKEDVIKNEIKKISKIKDVKLPDIEKITTVK